MSSDAHRSSFVIIESRAKDRPEGSDPPSEQVDYYRDDYGNYCRDYCRDDDADVGPATVMRGS